MRSFSRQFIALYSNYQFITALLGKLEEADMSWVKHIETT
jgi:uncharacterized protein YlbG (UPF0298 family)